jgi:hypothetical protein
MEQGMGKKQEKHTGGGFRIGLHARRHDYEGRSIDVGHAFITLMKDDEIQFAIGMAPSQGQGEQSRAGYFFRTLTGTEGRVREEDKLNLTLDSPSLRSQFWDIDQEAATRLMVKINHDRRRNERMHREKGLLPDHSSLPSSELQKMQKQGKDFSAGPDYLLLWDNFYEELPEQGPVIDKASPHMKEQARQTRTRRFRELGIID